MKHQTTVPASICVFREDWDLDTYTYTYHHNSLQTLSGNLKDKITKLGKPGIYAVSCNYCDENRIGQTKHSFLVRFKEHLAHANFGRPLKSSIAQHILEVVA